MISCDSFFPTQTPFFGTIKVEFDPFHFFLRSISEKQITIGVPIHSPHSMFLREFDVVDLHLAFKYNQTFSSHGRIDGSRKQQDEKEILYDLLLLETPGPSPTLYLELDPDAPLLHLQSDTRPLILDAIKNMLLLKKGVGVYLSHLSIYFSRMIGTEMQNYQEFAEFLFKDVFLKIEQKTRELLKVYESLSQSDPNTTSLSACFDFSKLAYYAEPEVNLDLYNVAFPNEFHLPYMVAMKELEEQIFGHFNNLVLIHHVIIRTNRDLLERLHRLQKQAVEV